MRAACWKRRHTGTEVRAEFHRRGRGAIPRPTRTGEHPGTGSDVSRAGQNRECFGAFGLARTSSVQQKVAMRRQEVGCLGTQSASLAIM